MPRTRHGAMETLRAIVLAVVVLVPLVAGGHHHDPAQPTARHSCSLCVVAYHTPATTSAAVFPTGLILHGLEVERVESAPLLPAAWSPEHGRAPPFELQRSSRIATAVA
jgi:hypothetical protein